MSRHPQAPVHGKDLVTIDALAELEASTDYDRQTSDSLVTSWEWTRTPSVETPFQWNAESPSFDAGALLNSPASSMHGVIPASQWSVAVNQLIPYLNQEGIRKALQILDAALNNVQSLKSRSQGPRDVAVHQQQQQQLMAQLMLLQPNWQGPASTACSGQSSSPSDLPKDQPGRNNPKA